MPALPPGPTRLFPQEGLRATLGAPRDHPRKGTAKLQAKHRPSQQGQAQGLTLVSMGWSWPQTATSPGRRVAKRLPYDPATLLLRPCSFIQNSPALQVPNCPSTGEGISNVWHIQVAEHCGAVKASTTKSHDGC